MSPHTPSPYRLTARLLATLGVAAALSASIPPALAQTATDVAKPPSAGAAAAVPADVFIRELSADVLATIRNDKSLQAGDVNKVVALVDAKILPHVNFKRMTASAVGRNWRQATVQQQRRLQDEFKTLLIYTYAGAISQIRDQAVEVKPLRARPEDKDVIVRTVVQGRGEPIQLDYRLEKVDTGWRIYDVNVLGAWLVQTYQGSFAQEVSASGIDGLIAKLAERNKQLAARQAG